MQKGKPVLINTPPNIKASEITDQKVYLERRQFLRVASTAALAMAAGVVSGPWAPGLTQAGEKLEGARKSPFSTDEALTPYEDVTHYNNFYEFGTDKDSPAKLSTNFRTKPWSVVVEGEVKKPAVYQLEDFVKPHALEGRISPLRCVEAWS